MSIEAPSYSELKHRAMEWAAQAHEGHFRKDKDRKIPYFSHSAMVGLLLDKAGFDEEVVAAGILHDVIEDTGRSKEDLAREFGNRVADLVEHLTEKDKSLPWAIRKERYFVHLETAPLEALAIACADKIHNLWSLILSQRSGRDAWGMLKGGREQQMARMEMMGSLFRERLHHPLADTFRETLAILKREC